MHKETLKVLEQEVHDIVTLLIRKGADYGTKNISRCGIVGIGVRLNDKCSRLLNLLGFDEQTSEFIKPKTPKNESINETLRDMVGYALIGLLVRKGKWK